jgi:glycine cleavage system H protein
MATPPRSGSPTSRPTSSATWSSSTCRRWAKRVEQFATFGVVESVKAVSDLYAPLSGEVVAVNGDLGAKPELVNSDPFGEGWMIRVKVGDAAQVEGLLDAAGYDKLTAEA